MPSYIVYEKPNLPLKEALDSAVLVKNHYSMLAFFFPVIWIVVKRLWWHLAAYLILLTPFIMLDQLLPTWSGMLVTLFLSLFLALEAPNFICWDLERKGYVEVTSLYAEDRQHGEHRYVQARLDAYDRDHKRAQKATPQQTAGQITGSKGPNATLSRPATGSIAPTSTQDRLRACAQKKPIIGLFPTPEQVRETK